MEHGALPERRTFLRSFVESIEKQDSQVTIHYTLPIPPERVSLDSLGVLYFDLYGSAYGIRTRDLRLERAVSWATRRMRHGFSDRATGPPIDKSCHVE